MRSCSNRKNKELTKKKYIPQRENKDGEEKSVEGMMIEHTKKLKKTDLVNQIEASSTDERLSVRLCIRKWTEARETI